MTQSLGGKIWVEDNDMGGASFKVVLPVTGEAGEHYPAGLSSISSH